MPLLLDDEVVDVGTGDPPAVSPPLPRPKLLIAMEIFLSSKMGMWLLLPVRRECPSLEWKMQNRFVTSDLARRAAPP
jgi:hypothetical protein